MEYQLKAKKIPAIVVAVCSAALVATGLVGVYVNFMSGDMGEAFFSAIYTVLGVFSVVISFNNIVKHITFNNVSFSFDGKIYTYQQIEKIGIHGGRYGRVFYTVYIDGKRIYTFDKHYYGADAFFYYLDFYKVPGAPRVGA